MSFSETSRTIAAGRLVVVNGSEATTGFPLQAPDGTTSRPSYSFATETNTGMYRTINGGLSMVVGGASVWVVDATTGNVALAGDAPSNYGVTTPGVGVVYLNEAVTPPATAPNGGNGGLLFVEGTELKYMNSAGTSVSLLGLSGDVTGPASATNDNVVLYNGSSGTLIKDAGFGLSASSVLLSQANVPGAPTYSFVDDVTTGMYNPAADELAFSTSGVRRLHIGTGAVTNDVPVQLPNGTLGAPAITFTSGGGMFLSNGNISFLGNDGEIGMSVCVSANTSFAGPPPTNFGSIVSGSGIVFVNQVTTSPTSATTGGMSLWVDGASLKAMTTSSDTPLDLTSCVEGPSSGATDNAVARFNGTTGDSAKNTLVLVNDTGEISTPVSSAALPTYTFSGETSTGVYSTGADIFNVSILGTLVASIDTTSVTTTLQVLAPVGTQALPGMAWDGDADTGMYLTGNGGVALSLGNSTGFVVSSSANITLCGSETSSNYGGGTGVIFLNQCTVNPVATATDRGILYLPVTSVNDLVFYDDATNATTISSRIRGPSTLTTTRSMSRWDGNTGKVVDASDVVVTVSGEVQAPAGTLGAPTYAFVGDTSTGLTSPVANTLDVIVSGTTLIDVTTSAVDLSQSIDVPVGALGTPSLTFTSDLNTGIFQPAADTLTMVGGGSAGLTATLTSGATFPNITLCSGVTNFGAITEGENVILIDDVSVAPSGTATGGGRIYVNGTDLFFHNDLGDVINMSLPFLSPIGSSVDGTVARFDGTNAVQQSAFRINDASALDFPSIGSAATPTFSFTSDTDSGMYYPSTSSISLVTDGVDRVTMSSTAVTLPSQALQANASLRVGGGTGTTYSLSSQNFISNVASASGTFAWSNNSGLIMNTTSSGNLAVANDIILGNTLTIGHNGTRFNAVSTTDIYINIGGANTCKILTSGGVEHASSGGTVTVNNRMMVKGLGSVFNYDYTFNLNTRGLLYSSATNTIQAGLGAGTTIHFGADANISFGLVGAFGTGSGVMFLSETSTIPNAQPNSATTLYTERSSGVFGVGMLSQSLKRSVIDGPRERATITRFLASVAHNTSTNTDSTGWASSDDYGVNGISTGEMATSDDCLVVFTATVQWSSNANGYRRLSIMRKTIGPSYALLNSVTTMAVNGDVTTQSVTFFGVIDAAADTLTVQIFQNSTTSLSANLTASFVRYETNEVL